MNGSIAMATSGSSFYGPEEIISVAVIAERIEITKRARPTFRYTVIGPNSRPPDRVWKEIWVIDGAHHTRLPDVEGAHIPETNLPEKILFPEGD